MTKRRTEPTDPTPRVLDTADDIPDAELELVAAIERLRAEIGPAAGYQVVVYKRSLDGKRMDRCRRFPLDDFDPDALPEMFGGGSFTLGVLDDKGKRLATYRLSFDPEIYPARKDPPPAQPAAPMPDLAAELRAERERLQRLTEILINAALTRPPAAVAAPSLKDRLDELVTLKGLLMPAGGGPKTAAAEIIEAMKMAMDLKGQLTGEGAESAGGGRGDLFERLIGSITERLIQATPPAAVAAGTTAPANGRAVLPQGGLSPDAIRYQFLRPYTRQLVGWARTAFDPGRVAAVIVNLVPPEHEQLLADIATMDGGRRHELMVQLDPQLTPYRAYIDLVAAELAAEFEDPDDDDRVDTASPEPA